MTRSQIEILMEDRKVAAAAAAPAISTATNTTAGNVTSATAAQPLAEAPPAEEGDKKERPVLPSKIDEYFLPIKQAVGSGNRLVYRPVLAANTKLHYKSSTAKIDDWIEVAALVSIPEDEDDLEWDGADYYSNRDLDFDRDPENKNAEFAELAASATNSKNYTSWETELKSHIYQERWLTLHKCAELKVVSNPGESEGEFRGRIRHLAHENRDLEVEKLKKKYASKLNTLNDRVRRAEDRLEVEEEQYKSSKMNAAISIGASVMGALLGRKLTSSRNIGRASTAARSIGRSGSAKGDIARAEEELATQAEKLRDLEREFEDAVNEMELELDVANLELEEVQVRPMKTDITVKDFGLCWTPWRVTSDGIAEPLWEME
jgi:hypothetical protein